MKKARRNEKGNLGRNEKQDKKRQEDETTKDKKTEAEAAIDKKQFKARGEMLPGLPLIHCRRQELADESACPPPGRGLVANAKTEWQSRF